MRPFIAERLAKKMKAFYAGNQADIDHFIRVWTFASLIGSLEGLDEDTQVVLESAAVVHDIACPLCREKYGSTDGALQEKESEPLLREFLQEFDLPPSLVERVIFLVTHHHTYDQVDGIDYQILLEADYLVNAGESEKYARALPEFRQNVFKTEGGLRLLDQLSSTLPDAPAN